MTLQTLSMDFWDIFQISITKARISITKVTTDVAKHGSTIICITKVRISITKVTTDVAKHGPIIICITKVRISITKAIIKFGPKL